MPKAIWILNDQCNLNNSALQQAELGDIIMMAESYHDLDIAYAHQKRTAFILAVNRTFAEMLRNRHHRVHYIQFNQTDSRGQLQLLIAHTLELQINKVILMMPKDFYHREILSHTYNLDISFTKDSNLISDESIERKAFMNNAFRMEKFYQSVRKKTGLLMQDGLPVGGQFNFDRQNQNRLNRIPQPIKRIRHTKSNLLKGVLADVKQIFSHQLGQLEPFHFAITASQAQIEMRQFINDILPEFGYYQDNIVLEDAYLYHSLLSTYLNIGLLNPLELCLKVQDSYQQKHCSIASAEGFIRQVLGWREYMFYRYISLMPQLEQMNKMNAHHPLPSFYWTAQTKMKCLANAVQNSLTHAYAHHIKRLMVLANFANLAQIDPYQVHQWFLGIYADAYSWVEMPNTLGMGLYADGGTIASKPYISSAAYIQRMSNACQHCSYHSKDLLGDQACPFNALYWNYIKTHQTLFKNNPRMTMMIASYQKFSEEKKTAIDHQVASIFERLDQSSL